MTDGLGPVAPGCWAAVADTFLDEYFAATVKPHPPSPALLQRYRDASGSELVELADLLAHPHRRLLVATLYRHTAYLPGPLVEPMLAAGIEEPDPSFNRGYLDPCLDVLGAPVVLERLLDEVEHGAHPVGAAQALYWAWVRAARDGVDVSALRQRSRVLVLTTFVERDDLRLRRILVGRLELHDPEVYPPALRPMLGRALAIGRACEDADVRARIELQAGNLAGLRTPR